MLERFRFWFDHDYYGDGGYLSYALFVNPGYSPPNQAIPLQKRRGEGQRPSRDFNVKKETFDGHIYFCPF
jgi:hypothetical protein